MGMVDYYEDIRKDAEKEGAATKDGSAKDLWIKAAAAPLVIASRKDAKARLAYWTEEAAECMLHADPDPSREEVLEDLLEYSPWRAFDEVWDLFEDRYGDPFEMVPTF